MQQIMYILNECITACSGWFVRIFNASGMVDIYIAALFIMFGVRFLLAPVFGSSKGSDKARRSGEGNSDE